ncbi:MAG TPA: hypothetical protein DDW65_11655 [Firmicutes bacterium]|jgi:ABC-type Zn uptake system ZnuABC Zn-binding protein ZnuA|nr:hypothetical protein [Bacillota bacterium]
MKKNSLILTVILIATILASAFMIQSIGLAKSDPIQVVTSLPLVKNIVEKVGGDKVNAVSIIQGSSCEHEYEASAGDMKKIATCDVFVKVGMGSDRWADKLASTLSKKALFLDPSKGIKTVKVHNLENPHYWGSPENVKLMAKNILDGLCSAAPAQKTYFTANYQKFVQAIDKTDAELKAKAATVANKEFVGYADAFPYFYQYFGFKNIATVEISCEQEVTPKDIAEAAKLMKARKIKVLVGNAAEPNEPDGLAKETNAKTVLIWATTNESNDYLTTLRYNVGTLVKALQ